MDFRETTVAALADRIRNGELTAERVAAAALERIDALDGTLNAFVALDREGAVQAARAVDERVARGEDPGPLAGVPLAVKDLEDARGLPTTFGSALHADAAPAPADSVEVARLRAAGCVVVGKTNTPEFGYKGQTDNPTFGATRNPWSHAHSAGGSSGGSAAALAAGMVPLATGSDGGGSIRIPAAVCGFSGIKVTTGQVPNGGPQPPTANLLAVRGPMARHIRDSALALDVVRGPDATDIYAFPEDAGSWWPLPEGAPPPMIYAPTLGYANVDTEVRGVLDAAVKRLAHAGARIDERDEGLHEDPVNPWLVLWCAGLARKLGDRRGTEDWARLDPPLTAMVERGMQLTAVDYVRALDACHAYNLQLEESFARAPFLLSATVAGQTPRIGEDGRVDGEPTPGWVGMTYGLNMTRHPAATVHVGCTRAGLPVGLQVIGRLRDDRGVLQAAAFVEDALGGPGHPER